MKRAYSFPLAASLGWFLAVLVSDGGGSEFGNLFSFLFVLFAAWMGTKVDQFEDAIRRRQKDRRP